MFWVAGFGSGKAYVYSNISRKVIRSLFGVSSLTKNETKQKTLLHLQLQKRPYNLLLLAAFGLFIFGFFSFNSLVHIHFQTKHYLFPTIYYIWTFAVLFLTFWLLYRATRNILFSQPLSWTHVFLTLTSVLLFFAYPYIFNSLNDGLAGMPRHYYDTDKKVYEVYIFWNRTIAILILLFTIGKLIYLSNLIIGFIQLRRNKR